jgi:tetratricopeptide (TPR) repeat protein
MRRAFRRQIRRTLAPDVPPILQRANNLLDKGEFEHAAEAFEQIADAAEKRSGPRAPMFYLQAGRAWLLAGHATAALDHIKHALSMFAGRGQNGKVLQVGNRIARELEQRGLKKESGELKAYLHELLPGPIKFTQAPLPASTNQPTLPTHCPSCGAAMRPDEVEWLDDKTAECAYCGSPVRGKN